MVATLRNAIRNFHVVSVVRVAGLLLEAVVASVVARNKREAIFAGFLVVGTVDRTGANDPGDTIHAADVTVKGVDDNSMPTFSNTIRTVLIV